MGGSNSKELWNKSFTRVSSTSSNNLDTESASNESADIIDLCYLGNKERNGSWQNLKDLLAEDYDDSDYQIMSDNKISAEMNCEEGELSSDSEIVSKTTVSQAQACKSFNIDLEWLEAQEDVNPFS